MSGDEIFENYSKDMEVIKKTYLALLKIPIGSWRITHQYIYVSLRNAIADFEGRSIEEVQDEYETLASQEVN